MKVAIASGKGGTGKTTVATSLARIAAGNGRSVAYLDCDVEEPNGHIFLQPTLRFAEPVTVPIPSVDHDACTHCGKCGEVCRANAIVAVKDAVLVFAEMCHGCGGCTLACPVRAISETPHRIGSVETGDAGNVAFVRGTLDIGQAISPPVIKAVKAAAPPVDLQILDAPPGTGCPACESVRGCDTVVLVTEPTPFGLSDLKLAVEMLGVLGVPMGVVINRADIGTDDVRSYCDSQGIAVLASIPDDRRIAETYSRGGLVADMPEYQPLLADLLEQIIERVGDRHE